MSSQSASVTVEFERLETVTFARFVGSEISSISDVDEPLDQFKREIEQHHPKNIVIDFDGVDFVATTAINMLLVILKRTRSYGGDVHLCNLSIAVRGVLDMMQLTKLFPVYRDRQDARSKLNQ